MKRLVFLCQMVFAACVACFAQQTVSIGGYVVDNTTGKAVAGVSVVGGDQAVVTNDDGYFLLKTDTPLEHVVVSHVGYRSRRVSIGENDGQALRISLTPTAIQLDEVLVVATNPRELVKAALEKIPQNYSRHPELYQCFYRETAMKRQHYIMVAEGVVDMYKTGYTSPIWESRDGISDVEHDRVAIRKGRRLLSPRQGDTLSVKVTGGPVTPVILDLVKNHDFLLNEQELAYYDMKMDVPTTIGDRGQYVVNIEPRCTLPYALYYGRLYIDKETLAFTRAELSLNMSEREKATRLMLVKKPMGVRFRPKELSLLVDYRTEGGTTRISYVRTLFRFNCDWRRRLFATSFTACCEMAVTSHNGQDIKPIRGRESFDQRDAFFDKVDYFRDPTFWQDYNIIEPTESLDRAIDRLIKAHPGPPKGRGNVIPPQ